MKKLLFILSVFISLSAVSQPWIVSSRYSNNQFGKPLTLRGAIGDSGIVIKQGTAYDTFVVRGIDTFYISQFSVKVRSLFSGTAPITYANGLIGITQATTSTSGYVNSTDWNTFNNKEPALGNPGTNGFVLSSTTAGVRSWVAQSGGGGTPAGSDGYIQYNNSGAFGANANLFWDKTKFWLGINTSSPRSVLDVYPSSYYSSISTVATTSGSPTVTFTGVDPRIVFSIGQFVTVGSETRQIIALTSTTATTNTNFTTTQSGATWSNFTLSGGNVQVLSNGDQKWHTTRIYNNDSPFVYNDGTSMAFGKSAFSTNTALSIFSTAIGAFSLFKTNSSGAVGNTALGFESGYNNVTGSADTYLGYKAGDSGNCNNCTFVGSNAGKVNTQNNNTAVGANALQLNTTGSGTAVGYSALAANVTGTENTAVGNSALAAETSSFSTAIGNSSFAAATGASQNTGLGARTGIVTTGSGNTFLGFEAGGQNTSGTNNIFIGPDAGYYLNNGATGNQTNSGATIIGYNAMGGLAGNTNFIVLGNLAKNLIGSNSTTIGNTSVTNTTINGKINVAGSADLTAQTGSVTVTSYTTGAADSTFNITGRLTVTSVSGGTVKLSVTYTDESNTSRTVDFFSQGTTTAALSATGVSSFPGIDEIRVKASTAITVATTVTGTITYNAGATITKIR